MMSILVNTLYYLWFWGGLPCYSLLHRKLLIVQDFGDSTKVYCPACKKYFGMHEETLSFVPWSYKLEEIHCKIFQISRTNK